MQNGGEKKIDCIKEVYRSRDINLSHGAQSVYNILDGSQRQAMILKMLRKNGVTSLSNQKVVDFGCGTAARLRNFLDLGAKPENLYGIDLSDKRIQYAKYLHPNFHFSKGDASQTEFESNFFDIVVNSTMFSSILSDSLSMKISSEIKRVVKNDGIIIWYDLRVNNPWNKNVRGYTKSMILSHFKDCSVELKSITVVPLITKKFNIPIVIFKLLQYIPIFHTHYIAIIRKII